MPSAGTDPATIVVDVGGTWTRHGQWRRETVTAVSRQRTPSVTNAHPGDSAAMVAELVSLICAPVPEDAPVTVGVSLGAALDHRTGRVYASGPLWGAASAPVDFLALLREERPKASWHLVNDLTAGLAAYRHANAADRHRKVVYVTVSSGIAARTFHPGTDNIPVDPAGLQGEIGHLPVGVPAREQREPTCACGAEGHVAAYSSGPGLKRIAMSRRSEGAWIAAHPGLPDAAASFEASFATALDAGDPVAHDVLRDSVAPLADVLTCALTLDPSIDRIVLAGGVIESVGTHYRNAVLARIREAGVYITVDRHPEWIDEMIVTQSHHDDHSNLIGAGLSTMGASTVDGHGPARDGDVSIVSTTPQDHQVVRGRASPQTEGVHLLVLVAGLCGTDIQILRGLRSESAGVLGHEALCVVTSITPTFATDLRVGDVVVVNPTSADDTSFLLGHNTDGVFQSSLVISQRNAGQIVRIGEVPTDPLGVLIEPLAVALYSLQTLAAKEPERYAIFGDGVVGTLMRTALRIQGVPDGDVRVISRRAWQGLEAGGERDLTRFLGRPGTAVVLATPRDSTDACLVGVLALLGSGSLIDVIGGMRADSSALLREAVDTRSAHVAGSPWPASWLRWERPDRPHDPVLITGHRGASNRHLTEAAHLLCRHPAAFAGVVTHEVTPEVAAEVFTSLARGGAREHEGRRIQKLAIRFHHVKEA